VSRKPARADPGLSNVRYLNLVFSNVKFLNGFPGETAERKQYGCKSIVGNP